MSQYIDDKKVESGLPKNVLYLILVISGLDFILSSMTLFRFSVPWIDLVLLPVTILLGFGRYLLIIPVVYYFRVKSWGGFSLAILYLFMSFGVYSSLWIVGMTLDVIIVLMNFIYAAYLLKKY